MDRGLVYMLAVWTGLRRGEIRQLPDSLRAWRPKNAEPGDCVVSTVPDMKCLRADLALAGIARKDVTLHPFAAAGPGRGGIVPVVR